MAEVYSCPPHSHRAAERGRVMDEMSVFAKVKSRYPEANQLQVESRWHIFSDYSETRSIGKGSTSDEAWADAAQRIAEQDKEGR